MNGITLLAIGDKTYGMWAFNMALSIKYHCNLPIQLIYQKETIKDLSKWHLSFFSYRTEIVQEDYHTNGKFDPARAKLNLDRYIYFPKSLCLDVDAILLKDPTPIFELKRYHVQTKGYMTRHEIPEKVEIWAHPSKIWEKYGLSEKSKFPIVETGIQLLLRNEQTNKIFNMARVYFGDPIHIGDLKTSWGHNQPDELYLGVSMAKLGYKPGFPENVKSLHATYRDKITDEAKLGEEYYCFGLWGNKALNHSRLISYYDRLVNKYSKKWGRNIEFKARHLLNGKFVKTNR
jgi:hypothetical protein